MNEPLAVREAPARYQVALDAQRVRPGYKQTEVGEIPEDWEVEFVENLAHITTGGRNTQDRIEEGEYPFFVRSQTVERINTYSFDGEAVLTAGDGVGTGKVFHYINGKFDAHQRVYRISDFSERLNGYFFYLYFSSNFYSRIMQMTAKSSVDSVRREMIARMQIPLPPTKAEQEAIAEALSDADALIASLERLIAKKRQLKQGAMQELLTGKKRLPGFGGEWSEICMRDALVQNATYGIVTAGVFVRDGVKMLRGGDIADGRVNVELPMVSLEKAVEYHRTALVKDDVVIALVGYPGAAAKIPDELIGANISRAVGLLRLNGKVLPDYLVCFLNSPDGRKMVLAPSAGSAQQVVNLAALNKLEFAIPGCDEQATIATILSDMDAVIGALERQLAKARGIKQGMMQELLTGRIRLV